MAENKTKATTLSVGAYLDSIADPARRQDCRTLIELMRRVTREEPVMWGTSIVGFGRYHYTYASGHGGEMCLTGFSSRKKDLTVYVMPGFSEHADLLDGFGVYTTGKSCLYLKRLADIRLPVLETLVRLSVKTMKQRHAEK
jgi:hypothetical protein